MCAVLVAFWAVNGVRADQVGRVRSGRTSEVGARRQVVSLFQQIMSGSLYGNSGGVTPAVRPLGAPYLNLLRGDAPGEGREETRHADGADDGDQQRCFDGVNGREDRHADEVSCH